LRSREVPWHPQAQDHATWGPARACRATSRCDRRSRPHA
jgi:hypothetical protein